MMPQIDQTIVGSRARTLSDGQKIQGIIYAPYSRGEDYVCEFQTVNNGVVERFQVEDCNSLDALNTSLFDIRNEFDSCRFIGDCVQSTGFEFWHEDPALNCLFEEIFALESMHHLLWRETVVRGGIHGKFEDVESIGPEAVATLPRIDEISTVWSKIIRIRQRIRIRVVALAGRGNSEYLSHILFSNGRVPVVRQILQTRTSGPPMAICQRFAKETENAIDISVWAPWLKTGSASWRCQYRIDGLGTTINAEILAVDSMRAICDVMDAIADELDQSSLTFGLSRQELDDTRAEESYHGFDRAGCPTMSALVQHLAAVEIQRNIILYHHGIGEQGVEGGEAEKKLHFHLREVERIRATFDPNYCAGNLKYPSGLD